MLEKNAFSQILSERGYLIIDGALATELEARNHDLDHPLWSAIVLRDYPDSIRRVHLDYYLAGADIAITASYQAATSGLSEHFGMDEHAASGLIKQSVLLAQQARDQAYEKGVTRKLLVAGSVGPYGAYLADGSEYRGDYALTKEQFQVFHRPRIQALIEAGVDLLAIETMPKYEEISVVLEMLRDEFPGTIAWLSCTLNDNHRLSDGTPLETLMDRLNQHANNLLAVGINCVPMKIARDSLQLLRSLTDLPLVCYPNSGETWDAQNHKWLLHGPTDDAVDIQARAWRATGATLIGGCCRTGPAFIETISKTLAIC
jgi:homocysteine S-methyltransferase